MSLRNVVDYVKRWAFSSSRVAPGALGFDGLHVHMICEDVGLLVMPISRRAKGEIVVRVEPNSAAVAELVVRAFSERERWCSDNLTEAISGWLEGTARKLMRYGIAPYRLTRLVKNEGGEEKVVGCRVVALNPSEIVEARGQITQRYIRRDHWGQPLTKESGERVIPPEQSVLCRLPAELEQARASALAALQIVGEGSMRTSALILDIIQGARLPIDLAEVRRVEAETVVAATRRFGWSARDLRPYNGFHLTYRQLQFERFLCELRSVVIGYAQEAITKMGRMLSFEATLVVEGLPTIADIDRAEAELMEGKRPFGEILNSVQVG